MRLSFGGYFTVNFASSNDTTPSPKRDFLIAGIVFLLGMFFTVAVVLWEKKQNEKSNQALFVQESRVIKDDLMFTMVSNAQLTVSAAAFYSASEEVSRAEWKTYVESLGLAKNFPEVDVLSYLELVEGPEALADFEAGVQAAGMPDFFVKPPGDRERYVVVKYLEPEGVGNDGALGFDILSEPTRREAAERAMQTLEPSLTSSIRLVVDEEDNAQAGAFLIAPIKTDAGLPGFVVSVFRMGDLTKSILSRADVYVTDHMNVQLSDMSGPEGPIEMYVSPALDPASSKYVHTEKVEVFGKEWQLSTYSTPLFVQQTAISHQIFLFTGTIMSLLLASIIWAEARRSRESMLAAQAISQSNQRTEFIMKELNHRSKNMLSLIGVIARQTSDSDPKDFRKSFSKRLKSLAMSQDLLLRNMGGDISMNELVRSQLAHFENHLGNRIMLNGPHIFLTSPEKAQTLSMAIHELSTNAAKYGALSNDKGTVDISWEINDTDAGKMVQLSWQELGGPPVTPPTQEGFGSQVTVKMVEITFKGQIESRFDRDGFEWHFTCPFDNLGEQDPTTAEQIGVSS